MQDQDSPGHGNGEQLTDAWWASLARRLLHPIQVEIIEALRQSDKPLSAHDLAEVVEGVAAGNLAHHLRRLRKLGAIAYADAPQLRNALDVRFRLVVRPFDDGH
jgi:DNA-binding transcriptional ArsR family regulator